MTPTTVFDLLPANLDGNESSPAVIDGTTTTSYHALRARSVRVAAAIAERAGVGDRAAILLPRSVDALAAFFAAQYLGAVPVFINEQLKPRQIAHLVRDADVSALVTDRRHRRLLRDTSLPGDAVIEVDDLPPGREPEPNPGRGRDLATLFYTSGSTGPPKGVMVSHDNLLTGAAIVAGYLHLSPVDRTLALLPWSFDYGLNQVLATFAKGGTAVLQRSAHQPAIVKTLVDHQVTGMAGVPTLWSDLTRPGAPFLATPLPHLRYLTNSGGHMPTRALAAIRAAHPATGVYLMYGLTEAFRSTYLSPDLVDQDPTSIGRPIPRTEILIIDDNGQRCAPGQVGQLVHSGPTVALGYWRNRSATAEVFRDHPWRPPFYDGEKVVYTGDYGILRDGLLYHQGRRDDLIKSRGHRVSPWEIEDGLRASDLVLDAVVTTGGSDGSEPAIMAAVIPSNPDVTAAELTAYCTRELPPHQRPTSIEVVSDFPRTQNGKIARSELRRHLLSSCPAERDRP